MASINLGRVVGQDGADGKDAKINGVNTLTLEAGSNITLEQEGSTLTINSTASGGTTDYSNLSNKPKINNVELSGNKTTSDLNISYNDLTNKPTIPVVPTNVSAFTNDAGYTTNTGTITSVKMNGSTISSSGEADLGTVITDISGKQDTIDSSHKLSSDLVDDTNATNLFVSSSDKTTWSGKQDALVSGTNIKTINNASILGSGNIDTEVIQYSTMPTASSTNVGQIVQFIGTTDSTYTNGYFYKCVEDNSTYDWTPISVQSSSGGTVPVYIWDGRPWNSSSPDTNADVKDLFQKILYHIRDNEAYVLQLLKTENSNGKINKIYYDTNILYNNWFQKLTFSFTRLYGGNITSRSYDSGTGLFARDGYDIIGGSIPNMKDDTFQTRELTYIYTNNIYGAYALSVSNTNSYTPTGNYNPATKKYVDDKLTTLTGYDATKTQVLKNVQGTLTWVDEA